MIVCRNIAVFLAIAVAALGALAQKTPVPTIYCVGDSTVNNSTGDFRGWCNEISPLFNAEKVTVANRARGGRSSRTFFTEGLWNQVAGDLKKGDYVLIQFGHNDGGPIDKEKFRGSLKGIGEESAAITGADGRPETVHTFGWYLRQFIADAKGKGAEVILLSPVPRNVWKDGKVERADQSYGLWARQVAASKKARFVDLNAISAAKFEAAGPETVAAVFFTPVDHTHTSAAGARLNAESVVEGLKKLKGNPLKRYFATK